MFGKNGITPTSRSEMNPILRLASKSESLLIHNLRLKLLGKTILGAVGSDKLGLDIASKSNVRAYLLTEPPIPWGS